ncbi:DDB1- and CUL4-associated factor 8-like [Scleropages formosus]|uniref:DDB1-and CUL4-associated factor 8-like n=1 Tax=Scleropages formosus TaxID=113540 RepID=A0A0P7TV26_SCLFO|nr:DDB1- and CUL4-associated factor 8-like [Scleropages formosus]
MASGEGATGDLNGSRSTAGPDREEEDAENMEGSEEEEAREGGGSARDGRMMDAEGDGTRETRKRRREREPSGGGATHSSSSSEEEDEAEEEEPHAEEDEQAIEAWLGAEVRELAVPSWRAVPSLRAREIGRGAQFVRRACGARGLVQRLELQSNLERHAGCVNTLHFNPSGTRLASGSDDLRVILWDWARCRAELEFDSGHKSNVFQMLIMLPKTEAAPCDALGTLVRSDHLSPVPQLALEPDSPCSFLSAGEDAVVFGIDLRLDRPSTVYDQRKINENDNNGVMKKFCPSHLVSTEGKANITCLVYSHNGSEVLASYNDEDIYLFDNSHGDGADYIRRYKGHRNNATVKGVNFYGPRSEFVVSGSDCGHIYLWEKNSARIVQFMEGDRGGVVNCLEPHPYLPVLATSGLDHDVKLWAPTAQTPTGLKGLKEVMKKNKRERDEDSVRHGDTYDTQLLWFLMRHMRHRRPQRSRRADGDTDESWSSAESSNDEDTGPDHVQCMSS